MATVNIPNRDEMVSRRVMLVSGGMVLALLLAIGAFFALRRRTVPLWLTRHAGNPSSAP